MKRNRIIVLSLIALSLVAISGIGVTFAWYYNGVYASVNSIDVKLKGEPNLLISTKSDLESFKSEIPQEELIKVNSFSPVSSVYSEKWMATKSETPKFISNYYHIEDNWEIYYATGGYFSQDIYLYSKDDIYATIDSNTFSFKPNEALNEQAYEKVKEKFPGLSKEEIIANLNDIYKSLRFSVLFTDNKTSAYNYVIYDPYKDGITYFAGALDPDIDGFYDFGSGKELIYGDYHELQKAVYDDAPSKDIPYSGINTCFNSGHKANNKMFNLSKSLDNGFIVGKEQAVGKSEIENTLLIPIRDEKPTKINISVYVEGWDVNNTNLCESASFLIDIVFKIKGEILP